MSDKTVGVEPDVEQRHNGAVRIVLDISDPVMDMGIRTDTVSVECSGSLVTESLADHIWDELLVNIEEYGIQVVE